ELAGRFVLPIDRRDRDDGLHREVELELLLEVVGIVLEAVERRRERRGLAAARVTHERDAAHVDFSLERAVVRLIELLPRLEMFQEQPGAAVVFATESVDEVFIDGRHDEAARREQFAEVPVTRIRELVPVVIAVDDEREREGTGAVRIPDAAVDRRLLQIESPEVLARLDRGARDRRERRRVNGLRLDA